MPIANETARATRRTVQDRAGERCSRDNLNDRSSWAMVRVARCVVHHPIQGPVTMNPRVSTVSGPDSRLVLQRAA
jgi:hypothetical protein